MKTLAENALLVGQILTVLFLQNPAIMVVQHTIPAVNVLVVMVTLIVM